MRLRLLLVGLVCGCPKPEATAPNAPSSKGIDYESAFSHEVRFDGDRGGIVVEVRVAPGFHAYTTGEETGRPMKLEVDAPATLEAVTYPKGVEKSFPIGRSVIVEGSSEVFGTVQSDAPEVTGTFHYQVCTDLGCDRPRRKKFSVNRP